MTNFAYPENDSFYKLGIYKPLTHNKKEIRLVRILPGNEDDDLVCELIQNVHLDVQKNVEESQKLTDFGLQSAQSPPGSLYWALSYAAGDPKETEPIFLNGHKFNVFRNLSIAMRWIRPSQPIQTMQIFIDQISIDQSNVLERGHQVAMMGDIYAGCHGCLAWLGFDEDGEEELVQDFLRSLGRQARSLLSSRKSGLLGTQMGGNVDHILGQGTEEANGPLIFRNEPEIDKQLNAYRRFMDKKWWKRYWVYQEAILAKRTFFLYGEALILRENLQLAQSTLYLQFIALYENLRRLCAGDIQTPFDQKPFTEYTATLYKRYAVLTRFELQNAYTSLSGLFMQLQGLSLSEAIERSRGGSATDPRDRIYALLGLLQRPSCLVPDYSDENTIPKLFSEVTRVILEQQKWLDILVWCKKTVGSIELGLPSWIPDFTSSEIPRMVHHLGSRCHSATPCQRKDLTQPPGALDYESHPQIVSNQRQGQDKILEISAIFQCDVATNATFGSSTQRLKPQTGTLEISSKCTSLSGIQEIYLPTNEPVNQAVEVCLEWGFKADPGHARTHLECRTAVLKKIADMGPASTRSEYVRIVTETNDAAYTVATDISKIMRRSRFFVTPNGYMAVGPAEARPEDTIAVFLDCNIPFVIRKLDPNSAEHDYILIGPTYLHGLDVGLILEEAHPIKGKTHIHRIRLH